MSELPKDDKWIITKSGALCAGCTACYAVCPEEAIAMVSDSEGFLRPTIDETACVECGLCRHVCPSNNPDALKSPEGILLAIAFVHGDSVVRANSSSGGAFTSLAKQVFSRDGVVYGVRFDENYRVTHDRFDMMEAATSCRQSKYVQSDKKDAFKQVLADLGEGREVLFTGTPCEVAGLKSLARQRHKTKGTLILCDVLCHGASSPSVFAEHVRFLEERYGKIDAYNFRYKRAGANWHLHESQIVTHAGEYASEDVHSFQECFDFSYITRDSCAVCPFAARNRVGDVTLGDYWGVDSHHPEIDDDGGVSLVLINSKKGMELFNALQEDGKVLALKDGEYDQGVLNHPCSPSPDRGEFWALYNSKGYKAAITKYTCFGLMRRILRRGRRKMRIMIKGRP